MSQIQTSRPPAPRLLAFAMLAILLVMLAPPTAAATILDEELTDYIDSSANASVTTNSVASGSGGISGFKIFQIERFQQLHYIVFDFSGARGTMPEGTYEFTYTIQGGDPQPQHGRVHVDYSRNLLNQITATKWTYFFDNWNVSGMTGNKFITTNLSIASFNGYGNSQSSPAQLVEIWGQGSPPAGWNYKVTVSAGQEWENRLTVNTIYGNDVQIQLFRNLNPSTLDIYQDGTKIYSSYESTDATLIFPKNIDEITVTASTGRSYTYPLSLSTPTTSVTTIHIRSAETGALISGARLTILDSQTGTAVVNETLANGAGTFKLEKSNSLRYLAASTAEGYTLLSAIQFDAVDGGTSVTLWMTPDAPPDDPIEDGKSMLYGYIQTLGSQQPISGATISLDGYGSTTTSSTGFYLFNNVTPGPYTITASAPLHDALSEPVTVETVATPYNLALKGHFLLAVTVKDDTSLTNLHNATISLSDGQESTQNPATFSADYGPYTITAAAGGYYPQTQSAYLDKPGTTTATVLLTAHPEQTPPPEYPNYPPHNVRFHCIDDFGLPLSNVSVSAKYLETTSPWSWFTDLLGIPSTVAINETTLAGTTGTDGSITFSMVEVVRYAITAHDPASNLSVNFTLYPQETQYTIQFRTRPPSDAETHPIYNLEAVPLEGDTQVSLRLAYQDRDNATTSLLFWVKDGAGEYVYTDTLEPTLLNWTNTSYTVENHPASYTWGFDATHATRDTISAARSITLHGSGRLVDLGFEDEFWYLLLSAIWIVGIGAIFSGSRVRFGAIIIPLIGGGVPTLIGWLPLATTVPIGILTFIGVFVYMRKSEYKLYR